MKKNVRGTLWKVLAFLFITLPLVRVYSADQTYWAIQVSSYQTEGEAKKDLERLQVRQFPNPRIETVPESSYPYKLMIGRFTTQKAVAPVLSRVQSLFPEAFKRSFTASPSPPAPPSSLKAAGKSTLKPHQKLQGAAPSKTSGPLRKGGELVGKKQAPPRAELFKPGPLTMGIPSSPNLPASPERDLEGFPLDVPEESPAEIPPTLISFEDLGYPKETLISGSSPEFIFYLPHSKGLTEAMAELALRLPSVLSGKSTLTVEVEDIPLFTKSLQEVGYTPRLSFPIPLSKNDHIKVTVRGHLVVTEDRCEDLSSGNLWMVIANKSRLILTEDNRAPENISDFFRNYKRSVNVMLDLEKVSFEALPLFYYIHPLNDWKKMSVTLNGKSSKDSLTLRVGRYNKDMEVKDGELMISEDKTHLLKKSLEPLFMTPSISNASISDEDQKGGVLRLSDLGIKDFNAMGEGDLSFLIPLRYSFFSGIPRDLMLELRVNHTPIPKEDKAFLRIFLNRLLLSAVQMEGGGEQQTYHVPIPEELMKTYNNTLEITASYFPHQGGCSGNAPKMTFSVSNDSRFYYHSAERQAIHSVVDLMGSLSGKVLVMIDDRKMFKPGTDLMHLVGQFNKDIRHIDVKPWAGEILRGYDFIILLLTPENTGKLPLPLKLDQGRFAIMNPITNKNIFGLARKEDESPKEVIGMEYPGGFGVFQAFDQGESKVLLMSYYKDIQALEFLKQIQMDDIGRFNGNVVLFNQNLASYSVGDKFRVVYQEARSLPYYLNRFKLPLVLGAILLILLFLYYVNKKLVRE